MPWKRESSGLESHFCCAENQKLSVGIDITHMWICVGFYIDKYTCVSKILCWHQYFMKVQNFTLIQSKQFKTGSACRNNPKCPIISVRKLRCSFSILTYFSWLGNFPFKISHILPVVLVSHHHLSLTLIMLWRKYLNYKIIMSLNISSICLYSSFSTQKSSCCYFSFWP